MYIKIKINKSILGMTFRVLSLFVSICEQLYLRKVVKVLAKLYLLIYQVTSMNKI